MPRICVTHNIIFISDVGEMCVLRKREVDIELDKCVPGTTCILMSYKQIYNSMLTAAKALTPFTLFE